MFYYVGDVITAKRSLTYAIYHRFCYPNEPINSVDRFGTRNN